MNRSTIAAVATPVGRGGIGIVKISGTRSIAIARAIFKRAGQTSSGTEAFASHRLYHGYIVDPETGNSVDEVLLAVMRAPRTYTREDVVEIQAHAGPVVIQSILDLALQQGARLAEPGEFTKRSYLNGRIDLTQAEAVVDVINAETKKALEIATAQIKGGIGHRITATRDVLVQILTETEAAIDFPEEVKEIMDGGGVYDIIQRDVIQRLGTLIEKHEAAHFFRDGLQVVIVGRPNVGKSSLLNAFIMEDRAIVTPIPGTTRDIIRETCRFGDIPVTISDSAGLHQTIDPVETLGIEKTLEQIDRSDLVLFMVEAGATMTEEERNAFERITEKPKILVQNKIDLVISKECDSPPGEEDTFAGVRISAIYGWGIERLKDEIVRMAIGDQGPDMGHLIVPNIRHKRCLQQSLEASISAAEGIRNGGMPELVAIDIKEAIDALGEIIGISPKKDVLDDIFDKFCIGK
jgi:tRNA modification GTPase